MPFSLPDPQVIMPSTQDPLLKDVEAIQQISIVSTMLEVITLTTGMGFAAIARVTPDRWIACGVRDEIGFGLQVGGELKIETTICNEIRDSRQGVIIDNVALDEQYCNHHTPRIYGIQSYISIPIILKDNSFFGTLCAIDPRPAQLNNPRIIGMFTLFADLIAFHLAALQKMEQTAAYLNESYTQLSNYKDEIRQYRQLSNHNLQEPLRKIRLFSDILLTANANQQQEKVKETTLKINRFAKGLSEMIRNIGDFSGLDLSGKAFETTDLNIILQDVTERLYLQIVDKGAVLHNEILHIIKAIPGQLSRLFYHLLSNSLKFSRSDTPAAIRIYSHDLTPEQVSKHPSLKPGKRYCEVCFEDNGIGIAPSQLEKIFDLFSRTTTPEDNEGFGVGLAQCRKIVRNHNGLITAHSEAGKGATFSVILPIEG